MIHQPLHHIDDSDTLGGRLSHSREAAGLSAGEVARSLGVLPSTWDAWERDRNVPRANRLTMIAGLLGVSPSWLLGGFGTGPTEDEGRAGERHASLEEAVTEITALKQKMREMAATIEELKHGHRRA